MVYSCEYGSMAQFTFTSAEIQELTAACTARLRELDKAFKSCMTGGVQAAAEKVSDRIKTVKTLAHHFIEEK